MEWLPFMSVLMVLGTQHTSHRERTKEPMLSALRVNKEDAAICLVLSEQFNFTLQFIHQHRLWDYTYESLLSTICKS